MRYVCQIQKLFDKKYSQASFFAYFLIGVEKLGSIECKNYWFCQNHEYLCVAYYENCVFLTSSHSTLGRKIKNTFQLCIWSFRIENPIEWVSSAIFASFFEKLKILYTYFIFKFPLAVLTEKLIWLWYF